MSRKQKSKTKRVRAMATPRPRAAPEAAPRDEAVIYSNVPGIEWPSILIGDRAEALAIQAQFEQTQWWPAERLRAHQFAQLGALVRHAGETVPYYRSLFERIGFDHRAPLDEAGWARLPLLTRGNIQDESGRLKSERVRGVHSVAGESGTSGSTATPIKVLKSRLQQKFWEAGSLRDHLWHKRDISGRHASIVTIHTHSGSLYPQGTTLPDWGPSVSPFKSGPGFMLTVTALIDQQVEWLGRIRPNYLNTFPSNLEALAQHCADSQIEMPWLRGIRTSSEILHPRVRDLCRRVFGLEIDDMYSSAEVGYMALQSPSSDELLVQAEMTLVEVLDEQGRPCAPGQIGRVVATPLHAFAMPLLRYVNGDLAEAGGSAQCGRGLPVLKKVIGRERQMLRLPTGELFYPTDFITLFPGEKVRQFQIVRTQERHINLRLVVRAPLTEQDENRIREAIQARFRFPFEVSMTYVDVIPREPSGKFFDFKTEVG